MGNYIQKFAGLFFASFLLTISIAIAQTPTFTWMSGDEVWNQGPNNVSISTGIYGTKTSPAVANVVGSRQGSLSWKDASGNLWLFGGFGRDKNSSNGYMNDLWKYNPTTNLWTWMKGSEFIRQGSVYGTKGTPSLNNTPSARAYSVTWTDANGDLWLFGGYGYDQSGVTLRYLNDLWKYNVSTNQWTWMSGSDVANRIGIYGTKGTAASDNVPGSRQYSVSWADANGNLWLFGGTGFDKNGAQGHLNDLWKYNIASNKWTWVSGSDRIYQNVFQNNVYGTKGTPSINNIPSARYSSVSWVDANGNLMLFGGYGTDKNGSWGSLNDLWRFNSTSSEWTWVSGSDIVNQVGIYGTKGTASANNIPGARRESVTWKDNAGTLWLFGGVGTDKAGVSGYLNDLWKYNSATNQWTWVGGGDLVNRIGTIGTKQTPSANNIPSSRSRSNSWVDASGNLWVFGGYGLDVNGSYGYLNNLWKYNISTNQWTWSNGSEYVNQAGNYGTKGDPLYDINIAGARQNSASWTDANGDYWFFGGQGRDKNGVIGNLNDLWKYNKTNKEWIWVSGSDIINQNGVYGTMGVAASANVPGARTNSVTWTDASGNLWLHGGQGRDRNGSSGYLNDLWKYNTSNNTWTWVKGSDLVNPNGVYGTKGATSLSNIPGGRFASVSFQDANGFLWLFGGYGRDKNGSFGILNDLWKYNISTNVWTWVSGDDIVNQSGAYGSKGVSAISNKPGARYYASGTIDANDNFWLYGGDGYDKNGSWSGTNDLWKYQIATNRWTWVSGSDVINQNGVYNTKGVSSVNNMPGSRRGSNLIIDANGGIWLFGGNGIDKNGSWSNLNDIWTFNTSINEWTWVHGSDIINQPGIYGTKGVSSLNNVPGARNYSTALKDVDGNLILFGGFGYDATGTSSYLNDLWKFNLVTKQWTWLSGNDIYQKAGVYGNKGVSSSNNLPGARQLPITWTDNNGYLWLFGGVGYDKNGKLSYLNDLWVYSSGLNEWKWVSGGENVNQIGVYGTKGLASVNNIPGARRGSSSWVDKTGNLWLFGGFGYDKNGSLGYLNDLWKYDIASNQWSWMGGSEIANQSAIYGSLGISASSNIPGARQYATNWVDSSTNTLWLYGGTGYIEDLAVGALNDLWKYNISTNAWTWVNGSKAINQNGVYGTKGVAANSNIPGARYYAQAWLGENGKLLLFGGQGYDKNASISALNDFWSYNINTNQWTWIGGGDIVGQNGVYGSKGLSAVSNFPGGRYQSNTWKDSKNNLWLFGGIGRDKNGSQSYLNDLWKYNPVNNQWTWISGSDIFGQFGVYGTKELPSINNIPGARMGGAGWKDASGNFWVFGGQGYDKNGTTGYLNDMWGIANCDNFIKPTFDANKKIVCLTDTASITISNKKDGDLFSWFYSNESDSTSNDFTKNFTDTMNVYVLKANALGCGIISSDTLRINKTPATPIIAKNTDQTLLTSSNNLTWYRNAVKLLDTTQRIKPDSNGLYSVVTTQLGCESLKSANVSFVLQPILNSINSTFITDTLSWSIKDSSRLKSFMIYKDTIAGTSKLFDSTLASKRKYIDSLDKVKNVVYYYKIKATDRDNTESIFSNELRSISFTPPSTVSPINLSVKNDTSILFKWRKIPNALKYNLEFGTDSTFRTSTKIQLSDTVYAKNLNQNTNYYWRVQTLDTTHFSSYSVISRFQTIISPPSLDSIKAGNKVDTLSWSVKDVNNLKYFKIYRDTVLTPTKLLDSVSGNIRRYIDTISLQNNKKYYYRILAGNQENIESNFSNILNVIPVNTLPKSVKLENRTVRNAGEYNFVKLSYSASGSFDTDGKIASYNWYVNDSLVNKTDSIFSYTYKLGSHAIKLIVIDNEGGKDSSISLLNLTSLQKVFPAGILGGISAINPNYILTADTSFNNTTGSSVSILDRSGNTIFPIIVQSKIYTTPSIASDTSIFITNGSSLNGYSKSGVSLWPTIPLGGISNVTPTIDSNFNRIYVGVSNKNFFAYDYKTGKNVWSIICDAPINTSAVITGDRKLIFTSQTGTLYGFDISKSDVQTTPKWKMSFGDIITKSPAVDASSNIYVGTNAGRLIKFMLNTDGSVSVKWNVILGSAIQTSPVIDADSNIYVGTEKGDFYKINRLNGSTIWSYNVGAAIYSTPNISEYGTIYVSNMNGLVTAITTDKRVLWKYQDIGPISANSLYINNMLYVATEKGTFTGIYDNPNSVNVNNTISGIGNSLSSGLNNISTSKSINASSSNISTLSNLITPRMPVWGTFQGNYRRTGSLSLICPSSLAISRVANGNLISNTPNYIQWYKDGAEIPNATDSIFKPTLAGNYFIKNNQAGCNAVSSNSYYFVVTDIVNLEDNQFVKVTPNPYSSNIYLHFYLKGYNSLSVDVVDFATGRPIANRVKQPTGSNLNLQSLSAGVYVIKVYSLDMKFVHMFKIVKL